MLDEFIKYTNTEEFYQRANFHLLSFKGQINNFKPVEFNFAIETLDLYGKISNMEYWQIIAHCTIDFHGMHFEQYLPYIKLQLITENHPLLWEYHTPKLECTLKNLPKDLSGFTGDLFIKYEKHTGNWLPFHDYFKALGNQYQLNEKRISIPKPLEAIVKEVCEKYNVDFIVKKETEGHKKGYLHRPNAKVLLFGNEDVSPNNYNLGQNYIIADYFVASKK